MKIILSTVAAAAMLLAATAVAQAAPTATGKQRASWIRQLDHSRDVLRFLTNRRHRWMLATNHRKCWQVPWQKDCRVARGLMRTHSARVPRLVLRLDATDPIVVRLNRGLAGTPMAGLGRILRDEGRRVNVSPFFIAAAAGTESSFGAAACGQYGRNAWGLGNCGSAWSVPAFETWTEAIRYYAEFLSERWPSATTPYHYYGYAACDTCWGRKTAWWMEARFGVSPYTRYPGPRKPEYAGLPPIGEV